MTHPMTVLDALKAEFPNWTIYYRDSSWMADIQTVDTSIRVWQESSTELRERIRFHETSLRDLANFRGKLDTRRSLEV